MSYKIVNKNGKCIRKGPCPDCPGFNGCDEDLKKTLKRIKDIRDLGLGYYSWEGNYEGPYAEDFPYAEG